MGLMTVLRYYVNNVATLLSAFSDRFYSFQLLIVLFGVHAGHFYEQMELLTSPLNTRPRLTV